MRSNSIAAAAAALFAVGTLSAQEAPLERSAVRINLPPDSPLALRGANLGESRVTARSSATVIDLDMSLSLQNMSSSRVRGVVLRLVTQEVAYGGRASVSVPILFRPAGGGGSGRRAVSGPLLLRS